MNVKRYAVHLSLGGTSIFTPAQIESITDIISQAPQVLNTVYAFSICPSHVVDLISWYNESYQSIEFLNPTASAIMTAFFKDQRQMRVVVAPGEVEFQKSSEPPVVCHLQGQISGVVRESSHLNPQISKRLQKSVELCFIDETKVIEKSPFFHFRFPATEKIKLQGYKWDHDNTDSFISCLDFSKLRTLCLIDVDLPAFLRLLPPNYLNDLERLKVESRYKKIISQGPSTEIVLHNLLPRLGNLIKLSLRSIQWRSILNSQDICGMPLLQKLYLTESDLAGADPLSLYELDSIREHCPLIRVLGINPLVFQSKVRYFYFHRGA